MLSVGVKIFRRVSKNCFLDFSDSRGLIDEKYVIKLSKFVFSSVQNDLC